MALIVLQSISNEKVTRIIGADVDNPYYVVGINRNTVTDDREYSQAFADTVNNQYNQDRDLVLRRKKEKSLDYNNLFLGEYKFLFLHLIEKRDEKEEIGSLETRSNNAGKPNRNCWRSRQSQIYLGAAGLSGGRRRLTVLFLSFSGEGFICVLLVISGSEPGEMAPESSQDVVTPKFDMHIYTSTLTTKELKEAITKYCIPTDLHPLLTIDDFLKLPVWNGTVVSKEGVTPPKSGSSGMSPPVRRALSSRLKLRHLRKVRVRRKDSDISSGIGLHVPKYTQLLAESSNEL
ncbi:hypothetical protein Tco_0351629 [Tanacetum coccineum]